MTDERVLVVPTAEFNRLGSFQGFSPDADRYLAALLVPGVATFRPRSEVEDDPAFKQIIPYVVFLANNMVFCYTRGKSQGEARLHHLRSLGVGGHVSEGDAGGEATLKAYDRALQRELSEEVEVQGVGFIRCVGLINDDSNPVGRVHLGVVHIGTLILPTVVPREDGLADAEFRTLDWVRGRRQEFETWSQIVIDYMIIGVTEDDR